MKVTAIEVGFYGKLRKTEEEFNLEPRSDKYITANREEKSDKKVTDAERKADVKIQFSSTWMEEVKS